MAMHYPGSSPDAAASNSKGTEERARSAFGFAGRRAGSALLLSLPSTLSPAARTEHRSVVLGEDLVLGPVGKHIDEIAQVPQPVRQGPDGEIPRGERLQIPQVTVSWEKAKFIPTTHRPQEED